MAGTRSILISNREQKNMFSLDTETKNTLRKLYLEMGADIFHFCEEHHLSCMLGGGSVLGAVRHQGFIPWDDDLDMNMPRKDYEQFARTFEKEFGEKYEILVPDGHHRISNLFMKVSIRGTLLEDIYTAGSSVKSGVSIDIFPIESVPTNPLFRKIKGHLSDVFAYAVVSAYIYQNRNDHMRSIYTRSTKSHMNYISRCILGFLMSFKKYPWWYCLFDRFAQCASDSALCTVPTGRRHYLGELREKSVFFPLKKGVFENMEVLLPNDCDQYLTQLYGDYMTIPSEEKREQHFYTSIKLYP